MYIEIGRLPSSMFVLSVVGVAIPIGCGLDEKLRLRGTDFSISEDDEERLLPGAVPAPVVLAALGSPLEEVGAMPRRISN